MLCRFPLPRNAGEIGTSPHLSTSSSSPSPVAVSSARHTASSPMQARPPLDDLTGARPAMLDRQHGRPQGWLTVAVEPLAAPVGRRTAVFQRNTDPNSRRSPPDRTYSPACPPVVDLAVHSQPTSVLVSTR